MDGSKISDTIKSDAPAISVIVPFYNTAPYLEDCIASVVNQTFTDFELILVDDASSDNSKELCENACGRDPRIHLLSSSQRKGVSHARNIGIDSSVGKYLFFLDSDDMLHPQVLEQLYQQAEKSDLDMCAASFIHSEICGEKSWGTLCALPMAAKWHAVPVEEVQKQWLHLSFHNVVWGKLFLKKAIQNLRFDEKESLAEDTKFNYQFITAKKRRISYTDSYGYYNRIRENSSNRSFSFEGLLSSLKIKRSVGEQELAEGRIENAVIMEEEYERQIRRWLSFQTKQNIAEKEKARLLLREEKKNPLFKEISFYEKSMVFLNLYFMPLYKFLYKVNRIFLRLRFKIILLQADIRQGS